MRAVLVNPTIDRDLELWHLGTAAVASVVNAVGRHQAEVIDFTFRFILYKIVPYVVVANNGVQQ